MHNSAVLLRLAQLQRAQGPRPTQGEEVKAWYMRMVGVMPRSKAKRVDT